MVVFIFHFILYLRNYYYTQKMIANQFFFLAATTLLCILSSGYGFKLNRGIMHHDTHRIKSKSSLLFSKHKNSKDGPEFLKEANSTHPSSLFASEVSSFGVSTALAEQHIQLGNYEDAKRLAMEAELIGKHTGLTLIYIISNIIRNSNDN